MPTYYARKAGDINATDVWATTPTGTAAAVTFDPADILVANSFTITVNVSVTVAQVTNTTTGGATAGGVFALQSGVTLSAAVLGGTATCVSFSLASPATAAITGNVSAEASGTASGTVANTSNGTLVITGAVAGPSGQGSFTVINSGSGVINITGNCSSPYSGNQQPFAVINSSDGTINIVGNITASAGGNQFSTIRNQSTGAINITGNVTGGGNSFGVANSGNGTTNIVGAVTGGSSGAGATNTGSGGTLSINGALQASTGSAAVSGTVGTIYLTGPFLCASNGRVANAATIWRWNSAQNPNTYVQIPTSDLSTNLNFVTPNNVTGMPVASNVRAGTVYASGTLTGTLAVPPAGSVVSGVPVDNTTGTAAITSAAIQSACDAALAAFSSGRLANVATVASTGQQLADALTIA